MGIPQIFHHPYDITVAFIPITAVITAVTTVLPWSPSPCHSLLSSMHKYEKKQTDEHQTIEKVQEYVESITLQEQFYLKI